MPRINRRADEPCQPVQTSAFTARIENLYPCDPTASGFFVFMPLAEDVGGSDVLLYNQSDVNDITVVPSGLDTIRGQNYLQLGPRESVILTSNDVDEWIPFGLV